MPPAATPRPTLGAPTGPPCPALLPHASRSSTAARIDRPTSAPAPHHICAGIGPHLRRDSSARRSAPLATPHICAKTRRTRHRAAAPLCADGCGAAGQPHCRQSRSPPLMRTPFVSEHPVAERTLVRSGNFRPVPDGSQRRSRPASALSPSVSATIRWAATSPARATSRTARCGRSRLFVCLFVSGRSW